MSAPTAVRSLELAGLHANQALTLQFFPGLNIVYGPNGAGKTTILHILANLLHGDLRRFSHLRFQRITQTTFAGTTLVLVKTDTISPHFQLFIDGAHVSTLTDPVADNQAFDAACSEVLKRLPDDPVYLPAFRSVLEAGTDPDGYWGHHSEEMQKYFNEVRAFLSLKAKFRSKPTHAAGAYALSSQATAAAMKTTECRRWFGRFVPLINYPSLRDVSRELTSEFQRAVRTLFDHDRKSLSNVFVGVLHTLLQPNPSPDATSINEVLTHLQSQLKLLESDYLPFPEAYSQLRQLLAVTNVSDGNDSLSSVLKLYSNTLTEKIETQHIAFEKLRVFQNSVNQFFEGKKIWFGSRNNAPVLKFANNHEYPFDVLSSGERHLLTLLFSATHMSKTDGVILIDEPELSLHVEWQRIIIGEMRRQYSDRQMIVCSHAPEIMADHRDTLVALNPGSWTEQLGTLFTVAQVTSDGGDGDAF